VTYEVIARKWRPQRFEDVVGQDHVTQTLTNAIASQRIAHAYLFVGPRGVGKTSVARIFAKSLNCENGPTVSPCGSCDACREIAAGTSLDVIEIDGASNNGVEQVRDLRDTIKYAPTRGEFKIYIIDEVHMLTTAAFNALLKTLEEPPAHVKFLFATTEPQKVLPTVVSRCQRFDLRRISVSLIVERLEEIAKSEDVDIDSDALLAVARGAEGGLRDAESALDQLISFKGKAISEADVLSVFGLISREGLEALADAILRGDIPAVIRRIAEMDECGKDLQRVVIELIEHFRNLLVCLNIEDTGSVVELTEAQRDVLTAQCAMTDTERVLRIVSILSDADDRMRFALSRRTLLETALIRAARAATVVHLEEILKRINELRGSDVGDGKSPAKIEPETKQQSTRERPADCRASRPVEENSEHYDLQMLKRGWHDIIEEMSKKAVLARSILVDARPVRVEADCVMIGFDSEFPEEMERFQTGRDRRALEQSLSNLLGRKVKADFTLMQGHLDSAEKRATGAVQVEKDAHPQQHDAQSASTRDWSKEDAVRKTLDTFNGSIVEVRE